MVEVTEADRLATKQHQQRFLTEGASEAELLWQAFATHREAAVKAERDRLLNWAANNFLAEGNYTGALVVHKLARALEQNP